MLSQRTPIATDIDRYLEKIFAGESLIKENKLDQAAAILEVAKQDCPKFPDAYILLAKLQEQMANTNDSLSLSLRVQSLQNYSDALRIAPKNNNVLLRRASLLKKLDSNEVANIDFETSKKALFIEKIWRQKLLYPHLLKYTEGYFIQIGTAEDLALSNDTFSAIDAESSFLGYIAESDNHFDLALYYFEKAVRASPLDFYSRTYQHHLTFLTGNKSEGLAGLIHITNTYKYPLAHWFLALAYLSEDNKEELAKTHFKKFIETADLSELYYFAENERSLDLMISHLLNLSLHEVNTAPDAEQFMVTASLDEQIKRLNKLSKKGKFSEIIEICDAALIMNPKNYKLFSQRGQAHYSLRHYPEAKLDLSICLLLINKQDKEKINALLLVRAYTHLHTQDFLHAKSDYKDACNIVSNNADLIVLTKEGFYQNCYNLGMSAYDDGNHKLALSYFELALIDKFKEAECLIAMAKTFRQLGRYEEALTSFERAKELSPLSNKLILMIGDTTLLYKQGLKDKAMQNRAYNLSICDGKIVKDDKSEDGYRIITKESKTATQAPKAPEKTKKPKHIKPAYKMNTAALTFPKAKKDKPFKIAPVCDAGIDEQAINAVLMEEKAQAEKAKLHEQQLKHERKMKQKAAAKIKRQLSLAQKRKNLESAETSNTATQEQPIKKFETVPIQNLLPHCLWENQRLNLIKPIPSEIYLPLLAEELEIFTALEQKALALNQARNEMKQYQHFICGASIWERLRHEFLGIAIDWDKNDSDFITELPCADVVDTFNTLPSESVSGLVSLSKPRQQSAYPLKIDIMHVSDLSKIEEEAKKRDYLPCYLDKNGKLYDPQNCLMSILYGVLKPARSLDTFFKDEPLIILRSVYHQVKRAFKLPKKIRKQMEIDKHLLLDSPRLSIKTVNIKLKELFSKHYAVKTFNVLCADKLIATLFGNIETEILANREWLANKAFPEVARDGRPPLERTYALLIFAGVAHRLNFDAKTDFNDLSILNTIFTVATSIIRESSLFSQWFSDVSKNDLNYYLEKARQSWQAFKANEPETPVIASEAKQSRVCL